MSLTTAAATTHTSKAKQDPMQFITVERQQLGSVAEAEHIPSSHRCDRAGISHPVPLHHGRCGPESQMEKDARDDEINHGYADVMW